MTQVLALLLLAAAVALWQRHAARLKKHPAARAAKRDARSRYHCLEVRPGLPACEAAQQPGHVRYLSSEAPGLPVSGCTEQQCACRYTHHDDRREKDRRNPDGQLTNFPPAMVGERRSRADRRKLQGGVFRPSIAH